MYVLILFSLVIATTLNTEIIFETALILQANLSLNALFIKTSTSMHFILIYSQRQLAPIIMMKLLHEKSVVVLVTHLKIVVNTNSRTFKT